MERTTPEADQEAKLINVLAFGQGLSIALVRRLSPTTARRHELGPGYGVQGQGRHDVMEGSSMIVSSGIGALFGQATRKPDEGPSGMSKDQGEKTRPELRVAKPDRL
jgi:hypothetical protein